jgi:hypothetical protein
MNSGKSGDPFFTLRASHIKYRSAMTYNFKNLKSVGVPHKLFREKF